MHNRASCAFFVSRMLATCRLYIHNSYQSVYNPRRWESSENSRISVCILLKSQRNPVSFLSISYQETVDNPRSVQCQSPVQPPVAADQQEGRDTEPDDEADPKPGCTPPQYKSTEVTYRQVDDDIRDKSVVHRDAHILHSA